MPNRYSMGRRKAAVKRDTITAITTRVFTVTVGSA
jgi:hypothetical protein